MVSYFCQNYCILLSFVLKPCLEYSSIVRNIALYMEEEKKSFFFVKGLIIATQIKNLKWCNLVKEAIRSHLGARTGNSKLINI